MDTCYFGRSFGVMVFRDHYKGLNIYWKYVKYETIQGYKTGVEFLTKKGWQILGIVCDGKRGMFRAFGALPVQMCQFHQMSIITRYITKNPKIEAGINLKTIVSKLSQTNREEFKLMLDNWYKIWGEFLQEKSYNPETGKWHYTHRRLRSAYRSLKTNLPYLFTYLDYPELEMPNTTNSLEGVFSNLKTKLRVHAGLKQQRKIKLINEILSN